jgi:nucleotide-binding universal stress UspA family protein
VGDRAERAAREVAPGIRTEKRVTAGLAPQLLAAESAAARLIVLGSHVGGARGALIGSVALKVAAGASSLP